MWSVLERAFVNDNKCDRKYFLDDKNLLDLIFDGGEEGKRREKYQKR
jgi:hypothetical protein